MVKDTSAIMTNPIRATLFGKFYEEIIREWVKTKGFIVYDGKPRIYWKDQPVPASAVSSNHKKLIQVLKEKQKRGSHCTPDGFMQKDNNFFVWEAKNWPLWYEPIDSVIWSSPWLLSKIVDYRGKSYQISGFIFSWWSKPRNEQQILDEVRKCIAPISFEIYYTNEILDECIRNQPRWYTRVIEEKQADVQQFFEELLGK